jgi:hypothetical protein
LSRDYEKFSPSGEKSNLTRNVLVLMVVAFLGGAILAGWLLVRYNPFETANEIDTTHVQPKAAVIETDPAPKVAKGTGTDGTVSALPKITDKALLPVTALTSEKEQALAVRVADLEDRLSRINVQAQAASGNAARAEGLLIAFAARRALDTGAALGYIESQLRLRFGAAQPKAVTTIVNASLEPVTLEALSSGLADLVPSLTSNGSDDSFWEKLKREMSTLFVVRKEGSPSPAPQARLTRAQRYIETGNVEAAIAEMEKLPAVVSGDEGATQWMEKARRYNEARRALDLIEKASILEQQQLRSGDGERVAVPSPLAPAALGAATAPVPAP